MDALFITFVSAVTLAVGFLLSFYFNKKKSNWLRILLGVLCGIMFSWIIGSFLWLGISLLIDENTDIPLTLSNAIARTFGFSLVSSACGAYQGYKKQNNK